MDWIHCDIEIQRIHFQLSTDFIINRINKSDASYIGLTLLINVIKCIEYFHTQTHSHR